MTSEKRAQKFHTDDASLPDLGSAFYWLKQISLAARPIKNTTQIWVVTRHQYGISALISRTSFRGKTVVAGVAKCRLFSQASVFFGWYFSRLTRTLIPLGSLSTKRKFPHSQKLFLWALRAGAPSPLCVSPSPARSLLRPLLPSTCYAGYDLKATDHRKK